MTARRVGLGLTGAMTVTVSLHDAPSPPPFRSPSFRLGGVDPKAKGDWSLEEAIEPIQPKPPKTVAPVPGDVPEEDPNMVTWDGPNDPENPQNWSDGYKWLIATVVIIMTINVTFATSAPIDTVLLLQLQFGVSAEISYLVTTVFLIGFIFGPLLWGPGSELIGRRPVFLATMVAYTVLHVGQAAAKNMTTLLVSRFFASLFASSSMTISAGVFADIFSPRARGIAASLFAAGVYLGPVLGPIVAGYVIEDGLSWRWVFWIMMIFAAACTVVLIFVLPETYPPVLLLKKARRLRKADPVTNANLYAQHEREDWSASGVINRTIFRPFKMLAMEPILLLITIYTSIIYGLLYALFEAVPIVFYFQREFTISQNGLIFIGVGIGTTLGAVINAVLSRHYPELIKKWKGYPPPEQRLWGAMVGAPSLVVAIFWFGWTGEYTSIKWYVPAMSLILMGAGISLIFMSFMTYLVDTYLMYSASAFAANTVIRSAVAASVPLFTVQMFESLHVNWASTLIGLISALFAPSPFLFYKYGTRIRQKSRFAPCVDLKIAKELEEEASIEMT